MKDILKDVQNYIEDRYSVVNLQIYYTAGENDCYYLCVNALLVDTKPVEFTTRGIEYACMKHHACQPIFSIHRDMLFHDFTHR